MYMYRVSIKKIYNVSSYFRSDWLKFQTFYLVVSILSCCISVAGSHRWQILIADWGDTQSHRTRVKSHLDPKIEPSSFFNSLYRYNFIIHLVYLSFELDIFYISFSHRVIIIPEIIYVKGNLISLGNFLDFFFFFFFFSFYSLFYFFYFSFFSSYEFSIFAFTVFPRISNLKKSKTLFCNISNLISLEKFFFQFSFELD